MHIYISNTVYIYIYCIYIYMYIYIWPRAKTMMNGPVVSGGYARGGVRATLLCMMYDHESVK